jgi:hypothetical protein
VRIRRGVSNEKLAQAVIRAAERRCSEFEKEMASIEKGFDDLKNEEAEED